MSKIKDSIAYIIMFFIVVVIAFCVYAQTNANNRKIQAKENRLNHIEIKLKEHTHYIDNLEADVDNLKERER